MFVWTVSSCLAQIVLTPTSVSEDFKFNHNHYKFFNSYWCLPSFIFHSFITVVIGQCNLSSQLNPPITELITITIATTTYPKKNSAIFKMEEFLTKTIVSTGDICSKCICSFGNWNGYDLLVTGFCCHPILCVIILMINKSDSHFAVVWFCQSLISLQTKLDSTRSYCHY